MVRYGEEIDAHRHSSHHFLNGEKLQPVSVFICNHLNDIFREYSLTLERFLLMISEMLTLMPFCCAFFGTYNDYGLPDVRMLFFNLKDF